MGRVRCYLAGILTAVTVAAVVHGDGMWLLFMVASDVACLALGLIAGLADSERAAR